MPEEPLYLSYYRLLEVPPTASLQQIRQAYRRLSKRYHPDTSEFPEAIATVRFQQLQDAYRTLSHPQKRAVYDVKMGYVKVAVGERSPTPDRFSDLTPEDIEFQQRCREDAQRAMQDIRTFFIQLIMLGVLLGAVSSFFVVQLITAGNLRSIPTESQQP